MKPIKTPGTNLQFHLMGSTAEDGDDLPVEQMWEDGRTINVSTWELTYEERHELLRGGLIELWVWGSSHPPVGLQVKGVKKSATEKKPTSD